MLRFTGYILILPGILMLIYFLNYTGNQISGKPFWMLFSLLILAAGIYLVALHKFRKLSGKQVPGTDATRLMESGELIKLNTSNCDLKTSSYNNITDRGADRIAMLDSIYDQNRNHQTTEVNQTYIVFEKTYNSRIFRFISPPIHQDPVFVKMHLDKEGINLYIDRSDPAKYYFELPFN